LKRIAPLLALLALAGCTLRGIALRSTTALLERGAPAFYEETDPQLGRESLAAQLKLLEALLRNEPGNRRLLLLAAEGFSGYAFLFLEDSQPERAKGFYLRGRDYALRALARKATFARLAELDLESLEKALKTARREDVAALFWAAFAWAGWINLSRDSPHALAELPRTVGLMQRVRELDPQFHFAGSDLFFAVYYASRPAILGGNLGKARSHFLEARRRTEGKYLMAYVLEARHLAVQAQDRELFQELLSKVREAKAGSLPNAGLTDAVAKDKARALAEKADDYF